MTLSEKIITSLVVAALLFVGIALARNAWNRRSIDALPFYIEPIGDVCECGEDRAHHFQRADRSRGACLAPTCACPQFVRAENGLA